MNGKQLGGETRGRWLAILALGIALGLGAGVALQRRALRDAPRRAEAAPDTDALAREVHDLRLEVRQTQRSIAAQPAAPGAPTESPPAPPPAASETDRAPTIAPAPPTQAERETLAAATQIVNGARQAGVWTAADRVHVRQLAPRMRPEDLTALMQGLAVEINSQKIRLPAEGGPVF